jgi:hypothetical protein
LIKHLSPEKLLSTNTRLYRRVFISGIGICLYISGYLFFAGASRTIISADGFKNIFILSFTTLTTVGYGDITPVHSLARSLPIWKRWLTIISCDFNCTLVSMEFESSTRKKKSDYKPACLLNDPITR